jgi:superfamily II DNA helicase RecQ
MQLKAFMIPVHDGGAATEEVNAFLRSNRILSVDRHFVQDGANSVWAICVSYLGEANRAQTASAKRSKVDYREVLSEADFAVFAKLRDLRKELAEREAIPAYALFTNEQLAAMVQKRVRNGAALKEIEGVGEARATKYGAAFLQVLCAEEAPPLNGSGGDAHEAKRH